MTSVLSVEDPMQVLMSTEEDVPIHKEFSV
jgi:hypothetical protein